MGFPPNAFVGTAEYYVRFRVPYPAALVGDLLRRCGARGEGVLVDLACGTGRLTFSLAPAFREVWGVDIEPEMLAAARAETTRRGWTRPLFHWVQQAAEDFEPPEPVELVSLGDAFHRLDQPLIAALALRWLQPGGALGVVGNYSFLGGPEPWQQAVTRVVNDFGAPMPEAPAPRPPLHSHPNEAVLRDAGFAEVATHSFPVTQEWTVDQIIGFLYSTSICSKRVLGNRSSEFEDALRRTLAAEGSRGVFRETLRFGYTFGRKPG